MIVKEEERGDDRAVRAIVITSPEVAVDIEGALSRHRKEREPKFERTSEKWVVVKPLAGLVETKLYDRLCLCRYIGRLVMKMTSSSWSHLSCADTARPAWSAQQTKGTGMDEAGAAVLPRTRRLLPLVPERLQFF